MPRKPASSQDDPSDQQAWPDDPLLALGEVDRRLQAAGEHAVSQWWWAYVTL